MQAFAPTGSVCGGNLQPAHHAAPAQHRQQRSCWSPAWEAARNAALSQCRAARAVERPLGAAPANGSRRRPQEPGAVQTDERTPAAVAEKQHAGSRQAGQRQQPQRKRSRGPGKRSSGSSERPAGSGEASGGQSERSTRLFAGGTKQSPRTAGNGSGNTGAAVAEKAKPREQSRASAALLAEAADVEAQLEVAAAADSGAAATAEPLLADHEWLNRCRKACTWLAAAGESRRAVRILSAAKAAAGASPADNATGGAVLRALCRERADSSAVAWALKALPPEQDFFAMLLQHYRARGSRKGVQQMAACLRESGLPPDSLSRNTWFCLVYCLAAVSDVVRAEKAFDRMRAAGAWRTDDCAFVNVLLDGRDVPAAFSRFEELQAQGFKGDLVTFNTLLKTAMQAADPAAAERAHAAMLAAGVRGTDRTYNTLAFAYAAERGAPAGGRAGLAAVSRSGGGLPAKAPAAAWDLQKVQAIMASGGFAPGPGSNVWGSLLAAAGKAGQGASVRALWAEALAASGGRCPSLDLLHAFMHACSCCSQGELALVAFEEMCPAQLAPAIRTYNTAIAACHSAPGEALPRASLAAALQLLRRAKRDGLQPDTVTYGALIRLCARGGRGRPALVLYQDMQRRGVKDNREVCTALLEALGGAGMVEEAARVWRRMVLGPARRKADRQTFLKASEVFRKAGDLQRALHAYNGMRKKGFAPSNVEFRALMLAATEAALRGGAAAGTPLAPEHLPGGAGSAASAGRGAEGGGGGAGLGPLDLHGLSAAEARAAVLTALSQLQEWHRQGRAMYGDLVLITGAGQHSAGVPVLRESVLRLLASLQLPAASVSGNDASGGAVAGGGADGGAEGAPRQGSGAIGSAFGGYSRFTPRRAAVQDASPLVDTLVDTGLRLRHASLTAMPGGGAFGSWRAAAEWSQANAAALTEAIILDWAASSSHAWAFSSMDCYGNAGDRPPAAAAGAAAAGRLAPRPVAHGHGGDPAVNGVGGGGGKAGRGGGGAGGAAENAGRLIKAAWSGTRWMDRALQRPQPAAAAAAAAEAAAASARPAQLDGLAATPAAPSVAQPGAPSVALPAPEYGQLQALKPGAERSPSQVQDGGNPGRVVVPKADLGRWLQARAPRD